VEGVFFCVGDFASVPADKSEWRRRLRAQRNALAAEDRRRAGERLASQLAGVRLFRLSRRIACYLPNDGEIDTRGVIERIWRMRKTCYLPVLSPLAHDRLWFAPAVPGMTLVRNRFGIPQPRVPARELVRAQALDLLLLPLVGFDAHGNRLGMGGGFYDRSLEFLRHRIRWRKPHVLGLAYDFQRVDGLRPDAWDVPLQGVVTDAAVYLYDC
jgi:5-formyltetrahydrofolate cyclo-ligase